jgi:integrase
MSVRKRKWVTAKGTAKEAWIVDYVDGTGVRRLKTFDKKKEANTFEATAAVQKREGTQISDNASATVREVGEDWISSAEIVGLERSTTNQYRQHLDIHIAPFLGDTKLSALTIPIVQAYEDRLRHESRSPAMIRKILVSLGSLLAHAQARGLVGRNVVRDMRGSRKKGKESRQEKRHKGKLKVGLDIPTRKEIKAIVEGLEGRWRPLLLTAIFTGLSASELRGLSWSDVDFDKPKIRVHQRADRFNEIGRPKSEGGERIVPVPPRVINALREWKLECPKGELDLVFPNGGGNIESHANIINRGLIPAQNRAGITDYNGKAKYSRMHCLRHFYASWCINSIRDGGLGLPPKVVQERLGHASIGMTMAVYGHLFPRGDDMEEMAAAERTLLE